MNMENPSNSERLEFLWEYFVDVPWDKSKCQFSPIQQVIQLDMDVSFEEMLYEAGFNIEEITQIISEDSKLREFTD